MPGKRVCVIGRGVTGLSSALSLQEEFRDLDVTVVGDRPFSEITSAGPPGLFRPHHGSEPQRKKWMEDSYEHLTKLFLSPEAGVTGICRVSGHMVSDDIELLREIEEGAAMVDQFKWLSPGEMEHIAAVPRKYGVGFTSYISQSRYYVPYLESQVAAHGGKLLNRKVGSISDLSREFDIVINCAGLGAGELCNDPSIQPVRGVLIEVEAPWIKSFFFDGSDLCTYVIPGRDTLYLGGLRQKGVHKKSITESDRQAILSRCYNVIPSLRKARIVNEWCGLRPTRPEVRVELENIRGADGSRLPVIHNYGHGGAGFLLSWGCAKNVTALLRHAQQQPAKY